MQEDSSSKQVLREGIAGPEYCPIHTTAFQEHFFIHARQLGWDKFSDSLLLKLAERENFQLLITVDKKMVQQQNNDLRKVAILVLSTNRRKCIRAAHKEILAAVETSTPGSFAYLEI